LPSIGRKIKLVVLALRATQVLCGWAARQELTYGRCLFISACCLVSADRCRNCAESVLEFSQRR